MFLPLLIAIAHAAPVTPVQKLNADLREQLEVGSLVGFEVLKDDTSPKQSTIVYSISIVKKDSIIRNESRALYEKRNGEWDLVKVTPLAREIEFFDHTELRAPAAK